MVTLNKLAYDLLAIARGGVATSDDESISLRQIKFWIANTRAQLIREQLQKNHYISHNIKQSLGCVDMEKVDASICCSEESDCTVFRSELQIPNTIEVEGRNLITRVGPISITEPAYSLIPYERVPYIGYTPFKGLNGSIKAFILNNYVYLIVPSNDKIIRKINVQGVFTNPEDLSPFLNCDGEACYTSDSAYPISEHMIERMKKLILETNLKIASTSPSDNQGDSKFNPEININK